MIRDLTESLEAFLSQPGLPPELASVSISFERPTEPFAPEPNTLDLFLFDIRENVTLRNNEYVTRRVGMQVIQEPPPARVTCTYLVTAWPEAGPDQTKREHRLLSQALQLFYSNPLLADVFLAGNLAGQEPPLPMMVIAPESIGNPAEFWTAIGNKMKPALQLAVTFSMAAGAEQVAPAVISRGIEINGSLLYRIGGIVTDAASLPVAGATVTILGRSRTTETNARGEFTFPAVAAGPYSLRATSGALTVTRALAVPAPLGSNYNLQFP